MPKAIDRLIPHSVAEELIRMGGAERVGKDARESLKKFLEQKGVEIGKKATELAKHRNRKTVSAEDIEMAIKK